MGPNVASRHYTHSKVNVSPPVVSDGPSETSPSAPPKVFGILFKAMGYARRLRRRSRHRLEGTLAQRRQRGVQHQHDHRQRLLDEPRPSHRPLHCAGEFGELHPDQGGRLRPAADRPAGAVLHAVRRRDHQTVPDPRPDQFRVQLPDAERLRQHQLQPGGQPRHRRDDLPDDVGVHGRQQHLRSGRPSRAGDVQNQLVAFTIGRCPLVPRADNVVVRPISVDSRPCQHVACPP